MEQLLRAVRALAELEQTLSADYPARIGERRQQLVTQGFSRLEPIALERYFRFQPTAGDITEWNSGFAFLPKTVKGRARLPVLALTYDLGREPPTMSAQVASFLVDCDEGEDPISYGYRYESPEEAAPNGETSNHGYFHAQPLRLVRTAKRGEMALPGCPASFPDDGPTFPLDCDDLLGLLACALVSIYGIREFAQIQSRYLGGQFQRYLQDMRCLPELVV